MAEEAGVERGPEQVGRAKAVDVVVPATIVTEQREGSVTRVVAESFVGPMPPPHYLERYEATLPGAADRILRMAERAERHYRRDGRRPRDPQFRRTRLWARGRHRVRLVRLPVGPAGTRLARRGARGADLAGLVAIFVIGVRARSEAEDPEG